MAKYNLGDIVRLKSGGPKMTVSHVDPQADADTDEIRCQWFAGAKLERSYFANGSIEKVEPEADKK